MSRESFLAELKAASGPNRTTDTMMQPNRYCFLESATNWYHIPVSGPSIIVPVGTPGTVYYAFGPGMPINVDITNSEIYPMKNGFGLLFAKGDWWVNVQLAGSAATTQCFVVKDIGDINASSLMALLQSTAADAVDVIKWAGAALTAGADTQTDSVTPGRVSALVDATLRAYDGTNMTRLKGLAQATSNVTSQFRLCVDSTLRSYEFIQNTDQRLIGTEDQTAAQVSHLIVAEGRRSGYYSSRRGRRYTVKSPNITGVAAATALTTTAPTFLLVAGGTNELLIRRVRLACPVIGTSTSLQLLIKTDTADRFSSGGTTRTPATMNNGNVVATTAARSLEAPTATAEGGGTRDIDVVDGQVVSGGTALYEPEDGLIIAAGGSLLIYAITATAGATCHYVIEYEDANVQ
jgi:hypothetical protein